MPIDKMHFLLRICVTPKEVSIDFVNFLTNRDREFHRLHSITRDRGGDRLNKGGSASKVEIIGLPPSKSKLHFLNNVVKMVLRYPGV